MNTDTQAAAMSDMEITEQELEGLQRISKTANWMPITTGLAIEALVRDYRKLNVDIDTRITDAVAADREASKDKRYKHCFVNGDPLSQIAITERERFLNNINLESSQLTPIEFMQLAYELGWDSAMMSDEVHTRHIEQPAGDTT